MAYADPALTMVESFMIEDVAELAGNQPLNEAWKKVVSECQLEGQQQLLNSGSESSPVPFPVMKETQARVYKILCPVSVELTKYNASAIPLRVLQLVALSKEKDWFTELEVWYDDIKPDPILVGYRGNRYRSENRFIIARWGDELRSFPELFKLAKERLLPMWEATITEAKATAETTVTKFLNGQNGLYVHSPV